METLHPALLSLLIMLCWSPLISGAQTHTFGNDSFLWTYSAATTQASCGLTVNQVTAMVLAVTWPETGARMNYAPSPMTMGRYDNSLSLHYKGSAATYPRIFWYPGIGSWQLDEAGLGVNYSVAHRIAASASSFIATVDVVTKYCRATAGTPAGRRIEAWKSWYACRSGACETIYNTIYNAASDSLASVTLDSSVYWHGGMSTARSCRYQGVDYECYYIDWNNSQGEYNWHASGFGPNPVSLPFYAFFDGTYEYRYWMYNDTGYGRAFVGKRQFGVNGRKALEWKDWDHDTLCDRTTGRGACSP